MRPAKLHASGISLPALKMIQDYLLNQKLSKKTNPHEVHARIFYLVLHKVLFLVSVLFIIIFCDVFLEHDDCFNNTAEVIENLTSITHKLFT